MNHRITGCGPRASAQVSVALDAGDQLGEAPVWQPGERRLLRVDIAAGAVHSWDPVDGSGETLSLAPPIGFALPRRAGGLVLGQGRAVRCLDAAAGVPRTLAEVEADRPDNRFNDARCDAAGRLWAGTMSTVRRPGAAALYRIDPDGAVERVLAGTTISNGLGWSAGGDRMLFIDSPAQRVDVFDFDAAVGRISGRRTFAAVDPVAGLPDGLAVDAEDGVWVALFGGAALHRYDARGTLDAVVALPVTNPTCPAFGGPGLDVLYVTSARHRLSPEQLRAEPLAGALLALRPGVRGRAAHAFAG